MLALWWHRRAIVAYREPMSARKLRRPLILASIMVAMFMIAIEATIVSVSYTHLTLPTKRIV